VLVETIQEAQDQEDPGVVLLKCLVMKVKETVMVMLMGVAVMVTEDAKATLSVEVIIVKSMELSTMRKMTVVRKLKTLKRKKILEIILHCRYSPLKVKDVVAAKIVHTG